MFSLPAPFKKLCSHYTEIFTFLTINFEEINFLSIIYEECREKPLIHKRKVNNSYRAASGALRQFNSTQNYLQSWYTCKPYEMVLAVMMNKDDENGHV